GSPGRRPWPTPAPRGPADAVADLPRLRWPAHRGVPLRRRAPARARPDHRPRRARPRLGLDARQRRRPHDLAPVPPGRLPALAHRAPRHPQRRAPRLVPALVTMARPPDPVRRQELLDQVVVYLADHGLADASLRPMAKALGVSLN